MIAWFAVGASPQNREDAMEISINGRNVGITDRFREYATEKAEKVSTLLPKAMDFEIKVSRHSDRNGQPGDDRVELMIIGPGPLVRAEASGSDKYVAFDVALGKILEQIRRAKDRRKVHRGQHRPTSLQEASAAGFNVIDITPASPEMIEKVTTGSVPVAAEPEPGDDDWSPVVIRRKVFPSATMKVDEAVDHMELVGHDFYLFVDAETDRPSVVYRRKGWDYGVISLEDEAEATGVRGKRRARA